MPYADPRRSPYCAARHLLRRLEDAAALRRNPLVARHVARSASEEEVKRAARALVDRAFAIMDGRHDATEPHARRHSAILLRCDVLREARRAVAFDIGISLPQFERERRAAMARFAGAVTSPELQRRPASAYVQGDLASTIRQRAMRLADSGDRRSAIVLLDDVARKGEPAQKVRALICSSEVETGEFSTARSAAALRAASQLLHAGDSLEDVAGLRSAYGAALVRLRAVEVGPHAAADPNEETPTRQHESAVLLIARAEIEDARGTVAACRPLIARATELLRREPCADASLGVDLAFVQAQAEFWSDASLKGRTGLDRAVEVAREAGYAGRAAFGELSKVGGAWARTGDARLRRTYRRLLERIVRSTNLPKQTRFFAFWDAADIECGIGDPWRAAEAARSALALAPNAERALVIEGLLARAYARGGRHDVAERTAMRILEHPARTRAGVAQLLAKRTLADVALLDGRRKQSWESLRDAAELAQRYGTARLAAALAERLARFGRRGTSPFPSFS